MDDATRLAASDDALPADESAAVLLTDEEIDAIGVDVPGATEAFVSIRASDLRRLVAAADLAVEGAQALRDLELSEDDDVLREQMQAAGVVDADGAPSEELQAAIARCAASAGCWPL